MSEMSVRCECCGYSRDCRGCLQDENVRLKAELEACRERVGQAWQRVSELLEDNWHLRRGED